MRSGRAGQSSAAADDARASRPRSARTNRAIILLSAEMLQVLRDEVEIDEADIGVDEALGDRARHGAGPDLRAVEAADRADAEAGRGDEDLVGVGGIEEIEIGLAARDL